MFVEGLDRADVLADVEVEGEVHVPEFRMLTTGGERWWGVGVVGDSLEQRDGVLEVSLDVGWEFGGLELLEVGARDAQRCALFGGECCHFAVISVRNS
ncbi:hypothetical protein FRC0077_01782 [Corynebacterium diphtheriae]|nr:hypothetical protein FRC0076_01772 [Corynebacterium diphtheriae]CAB0706699.1 hypothetical protein FRC0077_01782 [Corynebacterium diphtheriae]CAB0735188.1 hypothetical protein FRC0088_01829 [Corynebacterium diphtheriae]